MTRNFNRNERQILYGASGGRCQMCGKELHGVFHADHIKPYSKGGKTDVANGQVLCAECNMRKSDEWSLGEWPLELWDWQHRCLVKYIGDGLQDFLAVATPGAGKTVLCLRIAHMLLSDGVADQIAIVVPSDHLKEQWATEAAQFGIHLQTSYDASLNLAPDFHGIITTYQAVAARHDSAKSYRHYCSRRRTFGIFDEIHHAGDGLSWGKSLFLGFEHCIRRLAVTGTPFRSDDREIPFVSYELKDGQLVSRADFPYGYGEALRDGVVRPVFFQTFDGDISWISGDEVVSATFKDELTSGKSKDRYRAAVSAAGWLIPVLTDAHAKLLELREDHPAAGGLVIARDILHATQIAELLSKISDTPVTLVTSESAESNEILNAFRDGTDEWIVAVKMVSEGVDIKRLRVGVYATNVSTELFFRQAVGRVVRIVDGIEGQDAWFYIARDPGIAGYAESLKEERNHVIDDDRDELLEDAMRELEQPIDRQRLFAVISAEGWKDDVIHDASAFSKAELEEAHRVAMDIGLPHMNPVIIAKVIRYFQNGKSPESQSAQKTKKRTARKPTLEQQKHTLRCKGGTIAKERGRLIEAADGKLDYRDINHQLNFAQDVQNIDECTLEQLRQRVKILKAWRQSFRDGTWREFTAKRYLREHFGPSFS